MSVFFYDRLDVYVAKPADWTLEISVPSKVCAMQVGFCSRIEAAKMVVS